MEQNLADACAGALHGSSSTLFLTLINALIASKCHFAPDNQYPSDYGPNLRSGDTFDFIVVGAGSAGSIIASRLSENPKWTVLLIEAGSYPSASSEIPALAFSLQNSEEDWQYKCEFLRRNRKMRYPRGKGLGGSSLLNYMIYFRGNRYDYDAWRDAGNDGWDFESVLPYHQKFENLQINDNHRFGNTGELKLSKFNVTDPNTLKVKDAYKELGYGYNYNEQKPLGLATSVFTTSDGRRFNTAKAFLRGNVKDRPNLYVALNAQVSKLLINDSLTVKGVEVRLENTILKIYARKEVILSAGSINSPHILLNSGIGPKHHLESLGIKVIKDSKVGENLQDHIVMPGLFYKLNKATFSSVNRIDSIYEFFMHGKGPLTDVGVKFMGFVNPNKNSTIPLIQTVHVIHPEKSLSHSEAGTITDCFDMPESLTRIIKEVNNMAPIIELMFILSYPKSVGKILLRSNDPFDSPLIYPNYLSNPEDVASVIEGIRFIQKLMKTKSLEGYNPEFLKFEVLECQEFQYDTDDYWGCLVRNLIYTCYHFVGSCKMGPNSDEDAVVDPRLRVYGVKGVRVIDGSIMPSIVGVNTNGPIILIGEKGAQMIKEDWEVQEQEE